MIRALRAAALALILVAPSGTEAQQRPRQPARPAEPAVPQQAVPEPPAAAYEALLINLAEVLGALTFLTDLCNTTASAATPSPGEAWRLRMRDLIEAEATAAGQKERLAGAYNRGYAGYATTYRSCTPSGRAAIEGLLADGAKLARALTERYGL